MNYKYEFDSDGCWYKNSCNKYKTAGCYPACIRYAEMHYLMNTSGIPKKAQTVKPLYPEDCDFNAFVALSDIKKNINAFVNDGECLHISSNFAGNGKTSWAIKLMGKYFDSIWAGNGMRVRGLFIHVPTFLFRLKNSFDTKDIELEEIKQLLYDVDIVVFDDIASTNMTNYDHSVILPYIDQRILNCKTCIFTSNIPNHQALARAVGERLASRINSGHSVVFKGRDRRGRNGYPSDTE